MAGVLWLLKESQRELIGHHGMVQQSNPRALELQAAKEILAEVFGVRTSEVDEMLKQRYEERPKASRRKRTQGEPLLKHRYNEAEAWPMEFRLIES
jgi:hypothetical protein